MRIKPSPRWERLVAATLLLAAACRVESPGEAGRAAAEIPPDPLGVPEQLFDQAPIDDVSDLAPGVHGTVDRSRFPEERAGLDPDGSGFSPALTPPVPPAVQAATIRAQQLDAPAGYFGVVQASGAVSFSSQDPSFASVVSTDGAVTLTDGSGTHAVTFRLTAVNGEAVSAATPLAWRNRVTMSREGVEEYYLNGPLGLEQGFRVEEPASPLAELRVDLALNAPGYILSLEDRRVRLQHADGRQVVANHLFAFDARGRHLPSRFAHSERGLALVVDTDEAVWPIDIDPVWMSQGELVQDAADRENSGLFGFTVALDGDVAAVSAPYFNGAGTDRGAVYIYRRSGMSWTREARFEGSQDFELLGRAMALSGSTLVVLSNTPGIRTFDYDGASWVDRGTFGLQSRPNRVALDGGLAVVMGTRELTTLVRRSDGAWFVGRRISYPFDATFPREHTFFRRMALDRGRLVVEVEEETVTQSSSRNYRFCSGGSGSSCRTFTTYAYDFDEEWSLRTYSLSPEGALTEVASDSLGTYQRTFNRWFNYSSGSPQRYPDGLFSAQYDVADNRIFINALSLDGDELAYSSSFSRGAAPPRGLYAARWNGSGWGARTLINTAGDSAYAARVSAGRVAAYIFENVERRWRVETFLSDESGGWVRSLPVEIPASGLSVSEFTLGLDGDTLVIGRVNSDDLGTTPPLSRVGAANAYYFGEIDTDMDGVLDVDDACPTVAFVPGYDQFPADGCTDNRDGDYLDDPEDACPLEAVDQAIDLVPEGGNGCIDVCVPGDRNFCSGVGACNVAGTECDCEDVGHRTAQDNCRIWRQWVGDICVLGDRTFCGGHGACVDSGNGDADGDGVDDDGLGNSCVCDDPVHFLPSQNCSVFHQEIIPTGNVCAPGVPPTEPHSLIGCNGNGTCNPLGDSCRCYSEWWNGVDCSIQSPQCPGYGRQSDGSWSQLPCSGHGRCAADSAGISVCTCDLGYVLDPTTGSCIAN